MSGRIEESEVGQRGGCTTALKHLASGEQRDVDRQTPRTRATGLYGALVPELRLRRSLLRGRLRRERRSHEQRGHDENPLPHDPSFGACSTNFCSASATSDSEIARPTNDATCDRPSSDPMS